MCQVTGITKKKDTVFAFKMLIAQETGADMYPKNIVWKETNSAGTFRGPEKRKTFLSRGGPRKLRRLQSNYLWI